VGHVTRGMTPAWVTNGLHKPRCPAERVTPAQTRAISLSSASRISAILRTITSLCSGGGIRSANTMAPFRTWTRPILTV